MELSNVDEIKTLEKNLKSGSMHQPKHASGLWKLTLQLY